MPDHDPLDAFLDGLDRPVAPRPEFARHLHARLLTELDPNHHRETLLPALARTPIPASIRRPSRWPWLNALGVAAVILLLLGYVAYDTNDANRPPESIPAVSTAASGPTAMFGGDPARTGSQPGPAPVGALTATIIADPSANFSFQPVIVGDLLYRSVILDFGLTPTTGEHGNQYALQALDLKTSAIVWSVPVSVIGTPAVAGSLIVARAVNWATKVPSGELIALDAKTGALRWAMPTGATPSGTGGSPIVLDGVVYTADPDGTAYAVAADTGALIWKSTEAQSATPAPAVGVDHLDAAGSFAIGDGRLFVPNADGKLAALDPKTGAKLWSVDLGQRLQLVPRLIEPVAVADGVAISVVGGVLGASDYEQDAVAVLAADTGATRWIHAPGEAVFVRGLTVAGDRLLVARSAVDSIALQAFDLKSGKELWGYRQAHPGVAPAGVSVVGDVAYLAEASGALLRLDVNTGAATLLFTEPDGIQAVPPLVVGGRIVLQRLPAALIVLNGTPERATPSASG